MAFQSDSPGIQGLTDSDVPKYFNFADVIDGWARKEQNDERLQDPPALWWRDNPCRQVKWSFQDVALNSKRFANVLSKVCGIKQGDRVMVIVQRIPEYWLSLVACLRTGGVMVPIPIDIGAVELKLRIMASKPKCVIAAVGVPIHIFDVIDEVVSMDPESSIQSRLLVCRLAHGSREGWAFYEELINDQSSVYESTKSLAIDPVAIIFTSGTTGNAKMVEHTQASMCLYQSVLSVAFGFTQEDLIWCLTSTGWVLMLTYSLFAPWLVGAGVFVHCERCSTESTLQMVQDYSVTSLFVTPSLLYDALRLDLKRFNFSSLRSCVTAGEPANPKVLIEWKERTGVDIREFYGQTETGVISVTSCDIKPRPGSMGKVIPSLDVTIIDDNGHEVLPEIVGNIVLRVTPNRPGGLFSRYVDDPQRTKEAFRGEFYITGDRGKKDEDGFLWFSGRTDDIIFSEGINVNPHQIENCLNSHPAVSESAVVSTPHPSQVQGIKAFVTLRSDYTVEDERQLVKGLQDYVAHETAHWMVPHKVEIVKTLPRTLIGKINRAELRKKEWQKK